MTPLPTPKLYLCQLVFALSSLSILLPQSEATLPSALNIEIKDLIEWSTATGQAYQLQKRTSSNEWTDVGESGYGNGNSVQHQVDTLEPGVEYRVVNTVNAHENPLAQWAAFEDGSGSYVTGENNDTFTFPSSAQPWAGFYNSQTEMYPLVFSNGGTITFTANMTEATAGNTDTTSPPPPSGPSGPSGPSDSDGTNTLIDSSNSTSIYFRFEKNPYPDVDPAYNTQSIQISGTSPTEYTLDFPSQGNNTFSSFVFFITERDKPVVVQNVRVTDDSTVEGESSVVSVAPQRVTEISWPSLSGVEYDIHESSNLLDWTDLGTDVLGDGNTKTIQMTMDQASRFIRVIEPEYELFAPTDPVAQQTTIANALTLTWNPSTTPTVIGYRVYYGTDSSNLDQTMDVTTGNSVTLTDLTPNIPYYFAVVAYDTRNQQTDPSANLFSATPSETLTLIPLFDASTQLEPVTRIETADALITRGADRGRGRHAREAGGNDSLYDIYLDSYWNGRAFHYEIIDRVGKSRWNGTELEDTVTINYTTAYPLVSAEIRAFYLGQTTLAQYAHNHDAAGYDAVSGAPTPRGYRTVDGSYTDTDSNVKYTSTVTFNAKTGRKIQLGDRMEIELSVFGLPATNKGRSNYYGTGFLYIVGEGMKPWYGVGDRLDSYPLPESTWLGGNTTHHVQYSAELKRGFKQMAYNLAPINAQPFMDGRRLHHTNFQDGSHSEPDNDLFYTHIGKRGPDFINNGCVDCHTNNGRAIPNSPGSLMTKSIVRVGLDASATIHPTLGTVLQVQSTSGNPEKTAYRAAYTEIPGTYGDGTPYTLRKPNYTFGGDAPDYYSVRSAPQLVGLGLLEAIDETTIVNLADPTDLNNDGISGRINALNDPETGEIRLGRFGYKASKARLRHHIASALNTDMGITTSIYPTIDFKNTTTSLEINDAELDLMYRYVALLALMPQRDYTDSNVIAGKALFTQANCVACHVETIETSDYHPLTELRSQTIHPYTDLLLHDMGTGLADNMGEGLASGSEWRTAPLWNIGYTEYVSYDEAYLHDGRARTLEEAILWHGGEAEASKEAFRTMSASDRSKLITFLKSL